MLSKVGKVGIVGLMGLSALVPAMVADVPKVAASEGLTSINELEAGTLIKFGGKEWTLLEPETGLIHMNIRQDLNRGGAFDPDSTTKFDPRDSNNIGYWLNTTWYNTLSEDEQSVVKEHSWGIGGLSEEQAGYRGATPTMTLGQMEGMENSETVDAKVGFLSVSEYRKYSEKYGSGLIGYHRDEISWLRTPNQGGFLNGILNLSNDGSINSSQSRYTYEVQSSRPALYVTAGTVMNSAGDLLPGVEIPSVPGEGDGGETDSQSAFVDLQGGSLTLATTAVRDFGTHELSSQPKEIKSGFSGDFTVNDYRGTQEGWRLDVTSSQFREVAPTGGFREGYEVPVLPVGTLKLDVLSSVESLDGGSGVAPSVLGTVGEVIDGGTVGVLGASVGSGAGKWGLEYGADALKLVVDSTTVKIDREHYPEGATPYEATISWDLVSAP